MGIFSGIGDWEFTLLLGYGVRTSRKILYPHFSQSETATSRPELKFRADS